MVFFWCKNFSSNIKFMQTILTYKTIQLEYSYRIYGFYFQKDSQRKLLAMCI